MLGRNRSLYCDLRSSYRGHPTQPKRQFLGPSSCRDLVLGCELGECIADAVETLESIAKQEADRTWRRTTEERARKGWMAFAPHPALELQG